MTYLQIHSIKNVSANELLQVSTNTEHNILQLMVLKKYSKGSKTNFSIKNVKFLLDKTQTNNRFSGSGLFLLKVFTFNSNSKKKLCNYLGSIIFYKNSHERVQRQILV